MADTRTKILDLAEQLTQTRGFNGFSYLDLAAEIGVKTASIHYHFKVKDDLAVALVERIHEMHRNSFYSMEADIKSPRKRLEAVIQYFQGYAVDQKFCMCGMMAAELHSVSPHVSKLLDAYFTDFETWLTRQFSEVGHKKPRLQALSFLSALEGSLLLSRLRRDPKIVHDALNGFLKG